MAGVNEYKCPACGAPISFSPGTHQLYCEFCGTKIDLDELIGKNQSEEKSAESNETKKKSQKKADESDRWAAFNDYKSQREKLGEQNLYVCESCGAEIMADLTTAATKCPYCDNNVILTDKVSGGLKPDAIIPFAVGKDELKNIVKKFHKGKPLLPRGFLSAHKIEEIQGVYVPFWLYDGEMEGDCNLSGDLIKVHRKGDYEITETSHFMLERGGIMDFKNIPVDASKKMDNDLMDSIEPFNMNGLTDFKDAYLSGFLADIYDETSGELKKRAADRIEKSTVDALLGTAVGYSNVRMLNNYMNLKRADMKYVLFPVYLINDTYLGKKYTYAVNGQTGKIVGELPSSKMKLLAWGGGSFGITALILAIITLLCS